MDSRQGVVGSCTHISCDILHYTLHFLNNTSKMITSLSTKSRPPERSTISNTLIPPARARRVLPWDPQAACINLTKRLSFTFQLDKTSKKSWCISDRGQHLVVPEYLYDLPPVVLRSGYVRSVQGQ